MAHTPDKRLRIFKYPIARVPFDEATITVPEYCNTLHVALQGDTLCLWALVCPTASRLRRRITYRMYCTGDTIDADVKLRFVTTFQDGAYVGHVFEVEA